MTFTLSGWATVEVFQILLVFVRIGAAMMLLPGFGEPSIPVRVRVVAALAMALAVAPSVAGLPAVAPGPAGIGYAVVAEAACGALLGVLCRTLVSAVLTAGQFISQSIGLTNIFAAGIAMDQSATIGAAIYAGAVATLFASGAYHPILRGLVDSYQVMPPAHFPNPGATARVVVYAGAESLRLAGQIALPFLILALLFNASLAIANRALPAVPVFMIANPLLVILGLYLLAAVVPGILDPSLARWSEFMELLR
jgi:flagellar biosynthetic protein FliR